MMTADEAGVNGTAGPCNAGPDQTTGLVECYPYRPLEHDNTIRLLLITPGAGEGANPTYSLLHAELGEIPYKALSYEWGLASDDDPTLVIDGHPVRIRKNLFAALEQISSCIHHLSFYLIWIDAICINQNDNAEKGHQVQKMHRLFSEAEQVLAWTGPAADDSEYAMDILNANSHAHLSDTNLVREVIANRRAKRAILSWCDCPYWKRVWIMQEIYLARRIVFMCGPRIIHDRKISICLAVMGCTGESTFSAVLLNDINHYWSSVLWDSALQRESGLEKRAIYKPLREWLYICATSQVLATDPRDYIYGVISLSTETQSGFFQIIPDYNKPVETVFQEVDIKMMRAKAKLCTECNKALEDDNGWRFIRDVFIVPWLRKNVGVDVQIRWQEKEHTKHKCDERRFGLTQNKNLWGTECIRSPEMEEKDAVTGIQKIRQIPKGSNIDQAATVLRL
ncbi:heterokaryon incompatibility protein-domain-containing protein [Sordaria brevicollis]|uniref:Heterokaryon incompatibility protein-domain-containing protein n=1 Tax=Sordaria brevicollis TaxID=83679 RepID=A0AAE0P2W0_SORBR|nr:heterokaryon incompatibility protein-domain-containing protein [Sordaria brevicollis]